jgi:hypothetical protein
LGSQGGGDSLADPRFIDELCKAKKRRGAVDVCEELEVVVQVVGIVRRADGFAIGTYGVLEVPAIEVPPVAIAEARLLLVERIADGGQGRERVPPDGGKSVDGRGIDEEPECLTLSSGKLRLRRE